MDRRSLLRAIGCGGISLIAGYTDAVSGCPELEFENEADYEMRIPEGGGTDGVGIDMAVSQADIADFVWINLHESDERWIKETDFERTVVIALKESGCTNGSDFEVLGVDWESDRVLHAQSCIEEINQDTDLARQHSRLLRVSYDTQPPEKTRYAHWEEGITYPHEPSE